MLFMFGKLFVMAFSAFVGLIESACAVENASVISAPGIMVGTIDSRVVRHATNARFPVSAAVEVPASASMVYLSGKLPPVQDSSQPLESPLAYGGDTKEQTVVVLREIEKSLEAIGLGLDDVVKMQVFLVGDSALGNKMDLKGFADGYAQFFGTKEQPSLPARTTLQVAGLANSGMRVEIEVTAVRMSPDVTTLGALNTYP